MDNVNANQRSQVMIMKDFIENYQSPEFESILYDEFEQLKYLTNEIRHYKTKTTMEGERDCNRKKNRYRDILPYDESRVCLNPSISDGDSKSGQCSDYINASFVHSALDGHYKYIASQGPNKETCLDFIKMLYQYNIKLVVCACNEYEGQKLKCHRYWTDKVSEAFNFHKNYYVTLKSKPVTLDGCVVRDLVVKYNNPSSMSESSSNSSFDFSDLNEFEFTQFHITNWPDHGVPDNVESIMRMLGVVRARMHENNKKLNESLFIKNYEVSKSCGVKKRFNKIPLSSEYLAVHCSAGCGRTGTIIAIDQVWTLLNENKLTSDFSMYHIARALREQRIAMIQTLSQYHLFAKAIVYLFEKKLKTYNDAISNQNFRSRLQSRISQSNYENFPVPAYDNDLKQPVPVYSTVQAPTYQAPDLPTSGVLQSQSNILRTDNSFVNQSDNTNSNSKVILRKHNNNNSAKQISRRSYMLDSSINTNQLVLSDENLRKTSNSNSNDQNSTLQSGKQPASSRTQHQVPNSPMESSPGLRSPRQRNFHSPNFLAAFSNKVDENNNNLASLSNSSNTPSASSSASSAAALSKSKEQPLESPTSDSIQFANSSKFFLNNILTSKQQNLIRSAKLAVNSATPTTPSSTATYAKNQNKTFAAKSEGLKQQVASGMVRDGRQPTSPLDFYPRKLFQQPGAANQQSDSDRIPDTLSMSGSLYLENSASTTDASTGTGRIVNKNSLKNNGELYLNDESMYTKEAGSVCEFLFNRLETCRVNNNPNPLRNNASPSVTSLDATGSLSSSVNSTATHTPVTTPTIVSKNQFKLTHNQAKLSLGKQIDLRKANPPLKAEIHESINKAMSPTDFNGNDLVENKVDLNNSPLLTQEGPKPPTRRKQKPLHQLRQYDDSTVSEKHSEVSSVNERTPKNGGESKPKATTVIYRNRSCSSTHYDNSHSMHNDQSEAKFEASFTKKSSLGEYSDLSSQSAKASKEQSVRNGLYIDLNMIKELRAKKTKPQFKLKSQKFSEKHINQTLPSKRFQMPPNYYDYQNEQLEQRDEAKQSKHQYHQPQLQHHQLDNQKQHNSQGNRQDYENYQHYEKLKSKKLNSPPPTKLRNSNNNQHVNQTHINQHIFIKNKLYNLNEQNSKHFFEKNINSNSNNNNNSSRFEDLYENQFMAFPHKSTSKSSSKNSESTHKRRSAHLFNL